jgi:hypothetical protein
MAQPKILTPLQFEFLNIFFQQPVGQKFFLTGGTALAEYYLQHRFSEFYFANMLRYHQRINSLPSLLKLLSLDEFHGFFETLARQVILKTKPPQ